MWEPFGKAAIVSEKRHRNFNQASNDIYVLPGVTAHHFKKLAASCLIHLPRGTGQGGRVALV